MNCQVCLLLFLLFYVQCRNINLQKKGLEKIPMFTRNQDFRKIDLSNNKFRIIKNHSFVNVTEVLSLKLNNNLIRAIEVSAFYGLGNLKILMLNNNYLNDIPKDLFINLIKLRKLYLQNNQFIFIPVIKSFKLGTLYLQHNLIARMRFPDEYRQFTNLKVIDLSYNSLKRILESDLNSLNSSRIESLKLKGNKLSYVSNKAFVPVKRYLRHLNIMDNRKLTSIGLMNITNAFDHIRHKKKWHFEIFAENIGMTIVNESVFGGLANISFYKLELSNNNITSIGVGFAELKTLLSLSLYGNQLIRLVDRQFSGLINLSYLNLGHNKIETCSKFAFANLAKLIELNLSFNRLDYLDLFTFNPLVSLLKLSLVGNRFRIVTSCKLSQPLPLSSLSASSFVNTSSINNSRLCLKPQKCDSQFSSQITFSFEIDVTVPLCSVTKAHLTYRSTVTQIRKYPIANGSTGNESSLAIIQKLPYQNSETLYIIFTSICILALIVAVLSILWCINHRSKKRKNLKKSISTEINSNIYEFIPSEMDIDTKST